jgi:ribose transport system substrate-binding protein
MTSRHSRLLAGVALCGLIITGPSCPLLSQRSPARRHIVALAGDLRNGGVLGVVIGIDRACRALGWELTVFDVSRSNPSEHPEGFSDGYRRAFALRPDGLVLVSGNIEQPYHTENLARAERLGIPVVGWHVAPVPGPVSGSPVIVNVSTASRAVAEAAAALVIPAANEPQAGVVIFTDTSIDFARHKSDQMIAVLEGCDRCTVLSVENIPLTQTATLVPPAIRRLLSTYGRRWTHSLAINDLYYDDAIRELVASDGPPPRNISAGDGSPAALLRIRHRSFQYASVAEPLLHQGWQLVDELYRAIHGQPPSGYVNPAYVVTQDTVARLVSTDGFLEPPLPYREEYRRLWHRAPDE